MKLTRRVLSLMLALCMIVTMFSGLTLTANASADTYQLVTDASTLTAGDQVIIVAADYDYAMGANDQSGNFRLPVAITKNGDTVTVSPGDVAVVTLTDAGNGKYGLKVGDEGYLTAVQGKNYLQTLTELGNSGTWTIAIDETGATTIVAESTQTETAAAYGINYNSSTKSARFSGYRPTSNQKPVVIYKLKSSPIDPPPVDDIVKFAFLDTSDLHGQIYATDYTVDASQSGTYKRGLTRVATYIDSVRTTYGEDNVFVSDSGDTIQGTPFTYYYAFQKPEVDDPAIKALRTIGYDMWVVGNHEFNYGLSILNRQLDYATSASTETESQMTVSMANYLDAKTNSDESKDWATWKGYAPYIIRDFDGVKVAVMGIGNPNIPTWDSPDKWEGVYFADVIETYKHYEAEMLEKADMIVLVSHSGVNSDSNSDFIEELVQTTNSISFVFSGHEHNNKVWQIKNADGKDVPVVQPYTKARAIGQVEVEYNKTQGTYTLNAKTVNMENQPVNESLAAMLKPYEDATWNEYMNESLGTADGDFPAANLGTAPSAFMDFVNTVQLWGAYDRTGLNTPDDKSDDTMAQLSISAPLTAGDATNLIPAGDIKLGDLFRLYRFENWFYQITMNGKEIRTWLEYAATKIQVDGDGNPYVTNGDLTYYDVIFGDGFSYVIDYTAEAGSRIASMTYNGVEVKDDDVFTVVLNNYRFNGGGGYVSYLNANGCSFEGNDESRVIYSTQFDMIQGEDLGQARSLLADYIREKKVISPTITSTWKLVDGSADADTYQFAVLSTTDMHGRSTTNDVSTQKEDVNSMERVATIVKEQRAIYGDDMLLIDNGDTIQGTLVAQYAINYKAEEENPMIAIMRELGYDVWVMGNHEFNFTPAQRDAQIQWAENAGIAPLGGNVVLVENGKNVHGEDVEAGSSFYDPYVIKTLDAGNGRTVRVAIIGLGNAANATWDLATNYPNLQFSSLDNPNGLLENEINKWTKEITDKNLADIIIVSAHSGKGTDDGVDSENFMLESQALTGAKNSKNVDLLIYGHDHRANIEKVTNADGKEIYIVDGGGTTVTKNVFTVTFDAEGNVADFTVDAEALALKDVAGDEATGTLMQKWYDDTYAWASAPLGTFNNGWTEIASQTEGKTNDGMLLQQTALLDFIHKAQIWCSWQSYKDHGIEGATVSIGSAVFGTAAGGVLSFVPKDGDTISTLELAKLYRYSNNLLCAVDMTPQQLYNWMSKVADMYTIDENGNPVRKQDCSIYGLDTFYGVDYTFDLTKPEGERVVSAKYNGVDLLSYEGKIRVTLNSYRLSGGYGFYEATGLTEADCCWTANQYLGADRAPVPTQLGEYVAHMGTVTPNDKVSHGNDSTWTLYTGGAPVEEYDTIAEALAATEGEFTVKGVVTMVDGKNVYVQDATGGICAYMATAPEGLALGDTIIATGTRKDFNTLPELDAATYVASEGLKLVAAEKTIDGLTTADVCTYVSIKDLEVTEVFDSNGTYSKPNITVKDAKGNTIQIYKAAIEKNEDGTWAFAVGDKLNYTGAVGINRGKLQLRNTLTSEITKVEAPAPEEVTVLYTNDVHTYINKALSYENIAALKAELEAEGKNVVLVDAGDHIQGTAYGSMDKGATIIKLMNAAGYDLATLGNHEFDYGMARTLEIVGEESAFDYVSSNFYHEENGVKGENVLDAYKVFNFNGTKVAFVGITTPESFTKSTPAYFQDENGNYIYGIAGGVDGKELYETVQAAIDEAAKEADYVIALGHLGDDKASQPWTSEELIANTTGLDAFIDGHSHSTVEMREVKDKDGNTVILTQTGSYFGAIGQMTIAADGTITTKLVTEYTGVDEDVKAIADAWKTEIDTKLGTVIGHTNVTFDNYDAEGNRLVRKYETNTGDFAADALYYLFDNMDLDVDVAIMNGGGVRNKAITGDITYKTCKDIHTFGNVACLQTVTGQQILDALEWGARDSDAAECGGFLQVSGLTYEIHTYIESTVQKDEKGVWAGGPTGEYRVKNVKVWNKETETWDDLDLEATYNLAGYNYTLRDLGDGFAMFDGAVNVLDYVMEDYMVLANYVTSFPVDETTGLPTITAENSPYGEVTGEGRITHVKENPNDVCDPFEDINQGKWYHNAVHFMIENNLMFGMNDTTFGIGLNMRRADLVCLLYRLEGKPDVTGVTTPFTDVAGNAYYANAIAWAHENKVVFGTTDTTFSPNDPITREQIVSIIYRYAEAKPVEDDHLPEFTDSSMVHDYAKNAFNWAITSGIIFGMDDGTLAPRAMATREQVCQIVMKLIQLGD